MLDPALKKKKPVFVSSTSKVYGRSTNLPSSREDDDLVFDRPTRAMKLCQPPQALDERYLAPAYWKEQKNFPS